MDLDKRILKNPLSGFDKDEAKMCLFLSKKGYFGNFVEDFEDVSKSPFGTLRYMVDGFFSPDVDGNDLYTFFLPEEFVNPEPPKTYRPFNLDEFRSKFPLLSVITFREKDVGTVYTQCFLGYTEYEGFKDHEPFVTLGSCEFRLNELFEEYELLDSENKYIPFGVKNE